MKIIFVIPTAALNDGAEQRAPEAELYLSIGRAVRDCLRHGISLPLIAQSAEATIEECFLALKYFESSNGFKLEALVEEWSWARIAATLSSREAAAGCWRVVTPAR